MNALLDSVWVCFKRAGLTTKGYVHLTVVFIVEIMFKSAETGYKLEPATHCILVAECISKLSPEDWSFP